MNTGDIRLLLSYNTWANRRILAAAQLLTPEGLQRDLGTSYGSVQGTLVHLLWAEWIWLERWLGRSPKQVFGTGDFPDLAAIEERLATIQRGQEAFIETLTDDRVKTRISYENARGERWEYSLGHNDAAHRKPLHVSSWAGGDPAATARPDTAPYRFPGLF